MNEDIYKQFIEKASLKQEVFNETKKVFGSLKKAVASLTAAYAERMEGNHPLVKVEFKDSGDYEARFSYSGDLLLFHMHTNVFNFDNTHRIMKSKYVKEDPSRAYCCVINVYNFLADSFRFNRVNDAGLLVARIFINKDQHFFIEGQKQLNFLYTDFENQVINEGVFQEIIENCLKFSLEDELMCPPYASVKLASVHQMLSLSSELRLKTAKKLGYSAILKNAEELH